ncbi:hypothetical protein COLO4_02751 [Corchorus olitorius]|uniref:Uncharacterized protein n=1 Tax=Corchorus olitorius TaxID=93759 RepID=A0A1R3L0D4_9ROSI|nr:hypothetical protein COLO4_02751 [Corchorus olitorius]
MAASKKYLIVGKAEGDVLFVDEKIIEQNQLLETLLSTYTNEITSLIDRRRFTVENHVIAS